MKKVKYETPVVEIVKFDAEDVIIASFTGNIGDDEVITELGTDIWGH